MLAPQALQQRGIQVQRHPDLAVAAVGPLGDDELLVGCALARRGRQAPTVGDQKVVHVVSDAHIVDAADEILQALEDHALQCANVVPPAAVGSTPRRFRIS